MVPYIMTPTKLSELKKQVVELLEKQFIRLVNRCWELQCY